MTSTSFSESGSVSDDDGHNHRLSISSYYSSEDEVSNKRPWPEDHGSELSNKRARLDGAGQKTVFRSPVAAESSLVMRGAGYSDQLSDSGEDDNIRQHSMAGSFGLAAVEGFIKTTADQKDGASYSAAAQKMMAKMGYQKGKGLGKMDQGRAEIVEASKQRGRRGLGLHIKGFEEPDVEWDFKKEEIVIEETVEWIPACVEAAPQLDVMKGWMVEGPKKHTIEDETQFCNEKILSSVLRCKSVFDNLESEEMRKARTRSNPYETIRGAFFQNRAAMKMANMDAALDFMFTNPRDKNGHSLVLPGELMYFADICAGPGGFSEYVLWRKKWDAKGFGFTLKNFSNDFKLEDFFAASSELFEPHYGVGGLQGDGNIYTMENLDVLQEFVLKSTAQRGVHFVMGDGGFSVDGQENIQEIRSKRLYLCQFLCALMLLRQGGHFVCKLFDLFTAFSVGLVYLMYRAFEQISIYKPITSRPANSERYIVCRGLRADAGPIQEYLRQINLTLEHLGVEGSGSWDEDVSEVVPQDVLFADEPFISYIIDSNEQMGWKQAIALAKIQAFAQNGNLYETRQSEIREKCLELWKVPDQLRTAPQSEQPAAAFNKMMKEDAKNLLVEPAVLNHHLLDKLPSVMDYRCVVLGMGSPCLLVSQGKTHIHKWSLEGRGRWEKVDGITLEIPRQTVLEAQFVTEFRGEGKGQRKVMAVHVLDALFLGGQDVTNLHFNERQEKLKKFLRAIHRPSRPDLAPVRAKEVFRFEEVHHLFNRLDMRYFKGSGNQKRLCYLAEHQENEPQWFFMPAGLYFIKIVKDPWMMAWSKSRKMKYFYNTRTREASYQAPPDSVADYKCCQRSRLHWAWEDGVKVHDEQVRCSPEKLSRDNVLTVVQHKMSEIR